MTSTSADYSRPASFRAFQGRVSNCFGCAPDNDSGLHLEIVDQVGGVRADLSFDRHLESYPGIIHGGILATVCDELMGHVAYRQAGTSVATSSMNVRFIAPVLTGHRYRASATPRRGASEQLMFHVLSEITNDQGEAMVIARAVFKSMPL